MIGIVIIAVSIIALSVFSEYGTTKPAPCTYIQEKIDTKTHCLYITHSEGEPINLSAIKIILMFPKGHRDEFDNSSFYYPASVGLDDNVFAVGDCIVINDVNITSGIDIEMFYVYTPSQLVIRHIMLHAPTNITPSTNTTPLTDTTPSTNTTPSMNTTPSVEVNQKPVANFTRNVNEGYVPFDVQFTDHSENTTGWSWNFGDGATSDQQNPAHTYSTAGTYTVNLTAINVNGTDSKLATINVLKRTPTISWNTSADITYGTALSSAQLNAQANVPGNFVYIPTIGTVLNASTQILHVDFTPTDTANYNTASKDVAINVNKANPIITWSKPADINHKTALSSIQLNAVSSVPGTFVYTPQSGTVLPVGTQTLHVLFSPIDTTNYNTASAAVQINVTKK